MDVQNQGYPRRVSFAQSLGQTSSLGQNGVGVLTKTGNYNQKGPTQKV